MTQPAEPGKFTHPPVIETRLAIQFEPLRGFRAAHFGAFWRDCLGPEWTPVDDSPPQTRQVERFDALELNPAPGATSWEDESLPVQAVFRSADGNDTVLFQPDRLTYRCKRAGGGRTYRQIRESFDPVAAALGRLTAQHSFGSLAPDLWEINYLNMLPQGALWHTPDDWPGVLPGLFAPGRPVLSAGRWATFNGDWYFDLPGQVGRLKLTVTKSVSNQTRKLALLLGIRASGPLTAPGASWQAGLDLGHDAAVSAFRQCASPEALASWGYQA